MKFIVKFIVFALLAASIKANQEMIMKVMTGCKDKLGATDEDIAVLMQHNPTMNEKQKCLFACVMGDLHIVIKLI
jgi:hypothetical protein